MKTSNNILRTLALCLVAMLANVVAVAQNKLYVEGFSIAPNGDAVTANVVLENTENISSLEFNLNLPEGLSITNWEANAERMVSDIHSLTVNNRRNRVVILSDAIEPQDAPFKGNSGTLFTLTFSADNSFVGGKITITDAIGSDASVTPAPEREIEVVSTEVLANVGNITFSELAMTAKLNKEDTLDVFLNSSVDAIGMEATLKIPAELGAKVVRGKNASPSIKVQYAPSRSRLIISSLTSDELPKGNNAVFSIIITPTAVGKSQIELSDVVVSTNGALEPLGVMVNDIVEVEVVDFNADMYASLKPQLDEVQKKYDEALAVINAYTTESGKAVAQSELATTIATNLAAEFTKLDEANEAGSIDETYKFNIEVEAYIADIEKLAAQGVAAEANGVAFAALNAQIAEAKTALDAAKAEVAAQCKDVAAQFDEAFAAVQTSIDALTADVKAKYDKGELTAESTVDTASVATAVEKVNADAVAAQAAHDAEVAKKAANEAAFTALNAQIAETKTAVDAAKAEVAEKCKDVAADFDKAFADAQASLDALTAEVKAKYDKVELTAESTVDTASVLAAAEKTKADAVAAQAAHDAEVAKKAANEEAYTRLTAEIAKVKEALSAAKTKITTECSDVFTLFIMTLNDIQNDIKDMETELKAAYKNVELTKDSTVDTEIVMESIETVVADATAAQAVQNAKKANETAYTALTAQIAKAQAALDAAKADVAAQCADVAADFADEFAAVQASIDALTADVKGKYDKVELTAESKVDTASVVAAVEKAKADAVAAQAAFDAEVAKKAANEAAFKALTAQIAEAQAALDAAKADVAAQCADVAANFTEAFAAAQASIDALTADVKGKYDKVELTAESKVDTASVVAAVEKAKADAVAAQAAFDAEVAKAAANEEAFARLTAEIEALQESYDDILMKMATECKDVFAPYLIKMNKIQGQIDDMKDGVEDMYDNVELTAETTVDTQAILDEINKLYEEAKIAQEEYIKTTGIDSVNGANGAPVAIYTLSGKKVTSTVKGQVYIFQYADGKKVKKVVK